MHNFKFSIIDMESVSQRFPNCLYRKLNKKNVYLLNLIGF